MAAVLTDDSDAPSAGVGGRNTAHMDLEHTADTEEDAAAEAESASSVYECGTLRTMYDNDDSQFYPSREGDTR